MSKVLKYSLIVAFVGICMFIRWYAFKVDETDLTSFEDIVLNSETQIGSKLIFDSSNSLTRHADFFRYWKMEGSETEYSNFFFSYSNSNKSSWTSFTLDPQTKLKNSTVVCLSSVFVGYLAALNLEDKIVGVDNLDFISNEKIKKNQEIVEVGNVGSLNMELLLAINPTYVLVDDFDLGSELEEKFKRNKIQLVKCNSFREETPLARAEWIKFFGLLFGESDLAETLYKDTEFKYHLIKAEAENFKVKPTVIMNVMWGDQWTIPGGNSFQARLMKDAGADYIFKNDTSEITIHTGIEAMLTNANKAEYWLNIGSFTSKDALLEANSSYAKFKAFQKGNLFNNNKGMNKNGGIPYWETSAVYPDWVLEDLLHIFHPELDPAYKFYFYQKVK